ncbi:MAG TPA: tol-pal system-associated acyl-CoA thioesterase [Steroidobacter sp.]|jgi:acyl-CoA thioester hydrolase|nr:tol-pal system-associated acyl-CoA thioesterase [Steroidobacter sp.]
MTEGKNTREAWPVSRRFVWPVRVYHEDTDGQGVVYYANYLKFMERARTEWLRAMGVEQTALLQEHGLIFAVVHIEANYRRPARYGELLQTTCAVEDAARASLTFKQEIFRDRLEGDLLLEGRVRVACLDAASHRPRALPASVLQEI